MTTWTLRQVEQARGLYVRVVVAAARPQVEAVRNATAERAARAMIEEAHAFAIELHPGDLAIRWSPDEDREWMEVGTMRWRPTTTEVEMRGGEQDGQRVAIERVGDSIRVARHREPIWSTATEPSTPIALLADTYELAGWREDERVWVYEAR